MVSLGGCPRIGRLLASVLCRDVLDPSVEESPAVAFAANNPITIELDSNKVLLVILSATKKGKKNHYLVKDEFIERH